MPAAIDIREAICKTLVAFAHKPLCDAAREQFPVLGYPRSFFDLPPILHDNPSMAFAEPIGSEHGRN